MTTPSNTTFPPDAAVEAVARAIGSSGTWAAPKNMAEARAAILAALPKLGIAELLREAAVVVYDDGERDLAARLRAMAESIEGSKP